MTPVEELRAAATTLRETAAPFLAAAKNTSGKGWYDRTDLAETLHDHVGTPTALEDDAWIALMHPRLAEPLAAWLEADARHWDAVRIAGACTPGPEGLAAARAINGTQP